MEKEVFNKFNKNDIALVCVIVVIAVTAFLLHNIIGADDAGCVIVKVDGVIQGVYSLAEEQEISINNGTNVLLIKNGKADMIEADCPDHLCVNQKAVSKNNENIICLPNKVIVEVESSQNSEFDAITN